MSRIEHFEGNLLKLKLHLENLTACATFEHFKACQVAFVTTLVAEQEQQLLEAKAERIVSDAAHVFFRDTEFVTKIQDAAGKITETHVKTQWQQVEVCCCEVQSSIPGTLCQTCGGVSVQPAPPPDHPAPSPDCDLMFPQRGHCAVCDEAYTMMERREDVPDQLTQPEPPAHADDGQPYDPVQDERAKRRTDPTPSQEAKAEEGA